MKTKELTTKEKNLIKKYETSRKNPKKDGFNTKKEMYLSQTDRNYKDGDRN